MSSYIRASHLSNFGVRPLENFGISCKIYPTMKINPQAYQRIRASSPLKKTSAGNSARLIPICLGSDEVLQLGVAADFESGGPTAYGNLWCNPRIAICGRETHESYFISVKTIHPSLVET
jgi:hypothetical protein